MFILLCLSCSTARKAGLTENDDIVVSRKYIGNYVGFKYSDPRDFGWPNTLIVKTSLDSLYGRIIIYSHKCDFRPGEQLFIRKIFEVPGEGGYWTYHLENENSTSYKLTEFQTGNKALAESFR